MRNQTWWNGSKFLKLLRDHWPTSPQTKTLFDNENVRQEIVKHPASVMHSLVTTKSEYQSVDFGQIIDIERYSSVTGLFRVTAYILRFTRNAKASTPDNETRKIAREPRKELDAEEVNQAEKLWIRTVQNASFAEELDFLQVQTGTFPPVCVT